MGERFEGVLVIVIIVFAIIAAIAQVSLRTQYNEKLLERKLLYQQFLQQTDHRAVFADYRIGETAQKEDKK